MSVAPYTAEEIEEKRNYELNADEEWEGMHTLRESKNARWLATVDALSAKLAEAELAYQGRCEVHRAEVVQ